MVKCRTQCLSDLGKESMKSFGHALIAVHVGRGHLRTYLHRLCNLCLHGCIREVWAPSSSCCFKVAMPCLALLFLSLSQSLLLFQFIDHWSMAVRYVLARMFYYVVMALFY